MLVLPSELQLAVMASMTSEVIIGGIGGAELNLKGTI